MITTTTPGRCSNAFISAVRMNRSDRPGFSWLPSMSQTLLSKLVDSARRRRFHKEKEGKRAFLEIQE